MKWRIYLKLSIVLLFWHLFCNIICFMHNYFIRSFKQVEHFSIEFIMGALVVMLFGLYYIFRRRKVDFLRQLLLLLSGVFLAGIWLKLYLLFQFLNLFFFNDKGFVVLQAVSLGLVTGLLLGGIFFKDLDLSDFFEIRLFWIVNLIIVNSWLAILYYYWYCCL